MFENFLANPNIKILLNTDFFSIRSPISPRTRIIYTGMIDEYFDRCLEWCILRFERMTLPVQDYQGTSVVNYSGENVPYTRIHEYKHDHPEQKIPFELPPTVICKEYFDEWHIDEKAYYLINIYQKLLLEYRKLAEHTSQSNLRRSPRLLSLLGYGQGDCQCLKLF